LQRGDLLTKTLIQTIDYDILKKATILMIILIIPMSYVHEIGHAIICSLEENEFHISVGVNGGSIVCIGQLENKILFYAFGGFFVTMVSLIPLTNYSWVKRNSWILIVSLSFALAHGINAIVETVFNKWYLENLTESLILLSLISFACYFLMLIIFGKKRYS